METPESAYCRGRCAPLLSEVGSFLVRPLASTGFELVIGLDKLPSYKALLRLANRKDLADLIEGPLLWRVDSIKSPGAPD